MLRALFVLLLSGCVIDTVPLPEGTRTGGDSPWNGGGGDIADVGTGDPGPPPSGACLGAPGTSGDSVVFRFEAATIAVSIERRYVSVGVGESSIYELDEMRIRDAAGCVVITEASDLEYQNSHHNWLDRAVGIAGGVRYELRLDYVVASGWQPTLVATDVATSAEVVPETALTTTGGPLFCWNCPADLPVLINEICTANDTLLADGAGDFDSWVELFNPSAGDIDLSGFSLASGGSTWPIPASTTIVRHEYLVIWLDGESGEGALHADFALASGEGLALVGPDGTTAGERTVSATAADESLIYDAATDAWVPCDAPSPGAANPDGF